jgi:hypothetical protein
VPATEFGFHPLQLTSVYASRVAGSRRPLRTGDPEEPRFEHTGPTGVSLVAGEAGFQCRVRIVVQIPVLGDEIFEGEVTVVAIFVTTSGNPLALGLARKFARAQAAYIVWPFARAYLDSLSMMTGVGVPPLPLLLVPRASGGR